MLAAVVIAPYVIPPTTHGHPDVWDELEAIDIAVTSLDSNNTVPGNFSVNQGHEDVWGEINMLKSRIDNLPGIPTYNPIPVSRLNGHDDVWTEIEEMKRRVNILLGVDIIPIYFGDLSGNSIYSQTDSALGFETRVFYALDGDSPQPIGTVPMYSFLVFDSFLSANWIYYSTDPVPPATDPRYSFSLQSGDPVFYAYTSPVHNSSKVTAYKLEDYDGNGGYRWAHSMDNTTSFLVAEYFFLGLFSYVNQDPVAHTGALNHFGDPNWVEYEEFYVFNNPSDYTP